MEQRQAEGIDYVNKTTTLPADVLKAMKPHQGLNKVFESMTFSHRKEYLLEVVSAKKPETRERRINKMIEKLLTYRAEKENKNK
ncbi:MAG: hypothetical protein EOP56_08950 [Sphingobacteriales bacterium]|nr:MAG: hypothetical protein EOP56_08950 [Sphingobacteriales bacterium]